MIEPLSAVGAAASLVQLADVALRASREAYEFLSELKHAKKEIAELREALRDTETNIRSLRNYVLLFNQSKSAILEHEVLSEVVTRAIHHFHQDISLLKAILPRDLTLAQKFRWVYNKSKINGITKRIISRKSDLNLALAVTGRLQDLRMREDTIKLRSSLKQGVETLGRKQAQSNLKFESQTTALSDRISKQADRQSQLLQSLQQNQEAYHLSLSSQVSALSDQLLARNKQQQPSLSFTPDAHRTSSPNLDEGFYAFNQAPALLNGPAASIAATKSSFNLRQSDSEVLIGVLQDKLRFNLKPMLEEVLCSSETRGEAVLRRMEAMLDSMNDRFGAPPIKLRENVKDHQVGRTSISAVKGLQLASIDQQSSLWSRSSPQANQVDGLTPGLVRAFQSTGRNVVISRQRWMAVWSIGMIEIVVQRGLSTKTQRTTIAIYVNFRPNPILMPIPGITLFYSSAPTPQGYQIAPTIKLYPIWTYENPIFLAICQGNARGVRDSIESGICHPNSQGKDGASLLWIAALMGRLEICEYLLSTGLKFEEQNAWGVSGVRYLLIGVLLRHAQAKSRASREERVRRKYVMANNYLPVLKLIGEAMPHILSETCDDLIAFWSQTYFRQGILPGIDRDWAIFSEEIDYLQTMKVDVWRMIFMHSPLVLLYPFRRSHDFFSRAISMGQLSVDYESPEYEGSFLLRAVEAMSKYNQEIATNENDTTVSQVQEPVHGPAQEKTEEDSDDDISKEDEIADDKVPITTMTELLIQQGADIYWMYPPTIESATSWRDISTIWSCAMSQWDVEDQWFDALKNSGVAGDDYRWGDKQRCQQAFRLRGATRSGIDEEDLALPSASGMRCRRCNTRYCRMHGSP